MALTQVKSISAYDTTIPFPEAYIRIDNIKTSKTELLLTVLFLTAKDKTVFDCKNYTLPFNLDGANVLIQGYEYLKTLPEFADAVDC